LPHIKIYSKKRLNFNEKYLKGINILSTPLRRVYNAFFGITEGVFYPGTLFSPGQ